MRNRTYLKKGHFLKKIFLLKLSNSGYTWTFALTVKKKTRAAVRRRRPRPERLTAWWYKGGCLAWGSAVYKSNACVGVWGGGGDAGGGLARYRGGGVTMEQ